MFKSAERFGKVASVDVIEMTIESLAKNGIRSFLVNTGQEAREKIKELIPHMSEVMTMTSMTLSEIGVDVLVNESNEFISVRNRLAKENLEKTEKQRLGAAHDWVIGSVHAVTENGEVLIASATGSQLPSYAYGASNVIWVVGTQKIVKDIDEGMERIYDYVYPLENDRALKAYGVPSGVNKILLVNKEAAPGRIHIIFINEKLGF